jgi:ABC-2 type transport system ATP-binding protein
VMHHGDTDSLRRGAAASGANIINITVHGEVAPLLNWFAVRPGWKLVEERRDGARAEFMGASTEALAAELRRLVADGVAVVDFHREMRRLEEAFVEMLRDVPPTLPN